MEDDKIQTMRKDCFGHLSFGVALVVNLLGSYFNIFGIFAILLGFVASKKKLFSRITSIIGILLGCIAILRFSLALIPVQFSGEVLEDAILSYHAAYDEFPSQLNDGKDTELVADVGLIDRLNGSNLDGIKFIYLSTSESLGLFDRWGNLLMVAVDSNNDGLILDPFTGGRSQAKSSGLELW